MGTPTQLGKADLIPDYVLRRIRPDNRVQALIEFMAKAAWRPKSGPIVFPSKIAAIKAVREWTGKNDTTGAYDLKEARNFVEKHWARVEAGLGRDVHTGSSWSLPGRSHLGVQRKPGQILRLGLEYSLRGASLDHIGEDSC
jgi:hypothetical protein